VSTATRRLARANMLSTGSVPKTFRTGRDRSQKFLLKGCDFGGGSATKKCGGLARRAVVSRWASSTSASCESMLSFFFCRKNIPSFLDLFEWLGLATSRESRGFVLVFLATICRDEL
jgi:hypothetical protein